jgi:hypothetical protein
MRFVPIKIAAARSTPKSSPEVGSLICKSRRQRILKLLNVELSLQQSAPSRLRDRKACFLQHRLLLSIRRAPSRRDHKKNGLHTWQQAD